MACIFFSVAVFLIGLFGTGTGTSGGGVVGCLFLPCIAVKRGSDILLWQRVCACIWTPLSLVLWVICIAIPLCIIGGFTCFLVFGGWATAVAGQMPRQCRAARFPAEQWAMFVEMSLMTLIGNVVLLCGPVVFLAVPVCVSTLQERLEKRRELTNHRVGDDIRTV